MRRAMSCSLALAGCIVLVLATPVSAEKRGVTVEGKAAADYVAAQVGKSWAVVIGVDRYEKVEGLKYAVADAKAIADLFKARGFEVATLYDQQATFQNILTELGTKLVNRVSEHDRVVIFFAGHGETHKAKGGREMGYLLPVGGDLRNLAGTSMNMSMIRDLTDALPAKQVLFLVDVCYGGIAGGMRSPGKVTVDEPYLKMITRERGRQLITAGGKDQQALEDPGWGHSVFTYYLLQGLDKGLADLDGDGIIPASELHTYLKKRVYDAARLKHHQQVPEMWKLVADSGEFVFFTTARSTGKSAVAGGAGVLDLEAERQRFWEEHERLLADERAKLEAERQQRMEADRTRMEAERRQLEEERQKIERERKLAEERASLDAERRKLEEERKKIEEARVRPYEAPRQPNFSELLASGRWEICRQGSCHDATVRLSGSDLTIEVDWENGTEANFSGTLADSGITGTWKGWNYHKPTPPPFHYKRAPFAGRIGQDGRTLLIEIDGCRTTWPDGSTKGLGDYCGAPVMHLKRKD